MNKKILKYFIYVLFLINIFLIPKSIFASELILKTISNTEDKSILVEARIDPEGKDLNVVEGMINFSGELKDEIFVDVDTGGSILTIWTMNPEYSKEENVIRFGGGRAGGFNKDSLLFKMKIHSFVSGNLVISSVNNMAYLNDGKGTTDNISSKSLNINIEKVEKDFVVSTLPDSNPPYFEFVDIGKDENTYDGKYFISFKANDDISGISYYEINEGGEITKTKQNIYILKNQKRNTDITIIAYDNAGNTVTKEIKAKINYMYYGIIIILLIFILPLFYFYKKKK